MRPEELTDMRRSNSSFDHSRVRWLKVKVFEAITDDLRAALRIAGGRQEMPPAAIFESRTAQSTVEIGGRALRHPGQLQLPIGAITSTPR